MQIKVSARHGHLSDATQQFIREKAEKILHFFQRIMQIEVIVDLREDDDNKVEFLVSAEHKHDFVASESHADLLAAVDLCLHKLEQQVKKYKEKLHDRRRTPHVGKTGGSGPEADAEE
ncbi:MAG: ribosome-associated translation inhibitor RaiA [Gemmataceae bacterium]|nr:ribosome-associated translation inhibitor RaiA [Gemmataceae bacterium]MCI0739314.1 ribosome-associated translation inhibitor RaiA [Gemmataceae bacterium]